MPDDDLFVSGEMSADMDGDIFAPEALAELAEQVKDQTIWIDRSYRMPEDVFGTVDKVKLGNTGIDIEVAVEADNPRAKRIADLTSPGQKVGGFSVGVLPGHLRYEAGGFIKRSTPAYRKRWKRVARRLSYALLLLPTFRRASKLLSNLEGKRWRGILISWDGAIRARALAKIKPDGLDIQEFQPVEYSVVPKERA